MAREPDALVRIYGRPTRIVSDNEFTSKAILKWVNENGVEWHYIDPGKPQQNPRPLSRTSGVRGLDDRKLQRKPEG